MHVIQTAEQYVAQRGSAKQTGRKSEQQSAAHADAASKRKSGTATDQRRNDVFDDKRHAEIVLRRLTRNDTEEHEQHQCENGAAGKQADNQPDDKRGDVGFNRRLL